MIPTVGEVYELARAALGEHDVTGGEAFGQEVLEPHFRTAYRKLIRVLSLYDNRFVRRDLHYLLPAHTAVFVPSQAGAADFGEPLSVWSKDVADTFTVTAASITANDLTLTTSTPHGLPLGSNIVVYGVLGFRNDKVNSEWIVGAVPSPTQLTLNGCIEAGSYVSGGTVVSSSSSWGDPIRSVDDSINLGVSSGSRLDSYKWSHDQFQFPPSSQARLLKVEYTISGNPPKQESRSVHLDDSLDFLAYYTAYLAAKSLGADNAASSLLMDAVGSNMNADANGGFLGEHVKQGILALQQTSYVAPRFRPRRNRRVGILGY
jgi:hypothetical protein